jgi:LysM repeat protein
MDRQEREARDHDYTFMESATRVRRFVDSGLLVPIEGNRNYDLHDVSYPYARPAVKLFIERLSTQFRSACGETLTVTSLTRPLAEQPANAHEKSVHPTGMAIDLRVPRTSGCRNWLERVLLSLEGTGVLEATRERSPAHYHIALFPERYEAYVESQRADVQEYIVRRGDALYSIARRMGTTVSALSSANGLNNDQIMPGQVLRIPE